MKTNKIETVETIHLDQDLDVEEGVRLALGNFFLSNPEDIERYHGVHGAKCLDRLKTYQLQIFIQEV